MKNYHPSPFDIDVSLNGGYLYTTQARLSSTVANQRLTQATLDMVKLRGKKIIDIGCGDGVFTYDLYKKTRPKLLYGVDSSPKAISVANKLYRGHKGLKFSCQDIYKLQKKRYSFDLAIVRGVIHHVEDPQKAIHSISQIASEILILEPNGYNPFLKIIEQISPYHRFHKERSYAPRLLRRWLNEAGFEIKSDSYVGIIPFFFPDTFTVLLKPFEGLIERTAFLKRMLCAVYAVYAVK